MILALVEEMVLVPVKLTALGKLNAVETVILFPTEMEPALVKFKAVNDAPPPSETVPVPATSVKALVPLTPLGKLILELVVVNVGLLATVTGPVNVIAPPVVTLASTTIELPATERELAAVPLTAHESDRPCRSDGACTVQLTALGKFKALVTLILLPTVMEPALVKFRAVNETAPPNETVPVPAASVRALVH